MPRKTLKQKLKSQLRQAKLVADLEHEKAGITINYELQAMQSVGLAHGVMATLLLCKQNLDIQSAEYQVIEENCQRRIAQCFQQLLNMGYSHDEVNHRIKQGH